MSPPSPTDLIFGIKVDTLKELRHDPRMCEIWLSSHRDSNASAILNLSELLNFPRI